MSQPDLAAIATAIAGPAPLVVDLGQDPGGVQTITINLPGVTEAGRTILIKSKSQHFEADGDGEMSDPLTNDLAGRVGRLEGDVSNIRADVAGIKERLSHMPTNAALWKAVAISSGAVIAAMWALIQFMAKPWIENLFHSLTK